LNWFEIDLPHFGEMSWPIKKEREWASLMRMGQSMIPRKK